MSKEQSNTSSIEELARELQEQIQGGASISDIIQLLTKEKEQIEELKEYIEKIANHPSVYDSEIANEGLKLIGKENL